VQPLLPGRSETAKRNERRSCSPRTWRRSDGEAHAKPHHATICHAKPWPAVGAVSGMCDGVRRITWMQPLFAAAPDSSGVGGIGIATR